MTSNTFFNKEQSSIIKHLPISIAIFDNEMKYLSCSNKFLEDYKLDKSIDIVGKSHYELFPDTTKYWRDIHSQGISGEMLSKENEKYEGLDGSIQYITWEVKPWYEENNTIGGIVLTTIDTTDIIKSKELVEKNKIIQTNLDNAIEIASLGTWEWDAINDISIWSDITYDIHGVDKGTFVNLEFIESLIYKDDIELYRNMVNNSLFKKVPFNFEYKIVKNDKIRTVLVIGKPILKNDQVIKMTGIIQDITDYRRKEETLLKAQKIAKIGEYELDLDTKIAHWSEKMVEIFGVKNSKETPGPKFLKKLMYEEDWNGFESSIQKCINQNVEHFCRYRVKRPIDGETVWIECRGEISLKNKLIGTVQNITQSKTLEMENHQKEELLFHQTKMAAMGEMLGNIAHQWRQPLSIISTAATGAKVQNEIGLLNKNNANSYFDTINNTAQYLSETIEDFRNFFNPKDNKEKEFNITDTISKTLQLVSSQFTSKNILIIEDIKDYKLISIENEIVQVLINILNNARDVLLTKENQKRLIFINTYKKDNISYIEILDNAGGIEESIINRIFEPYFTTKHQSQGTGIGLYMSEEIIHKHLHGKLIVSNKTYTYEGIKYTGALFRVEIIT